MNRSWIMAGVAVLTMYSVASGQQTYLYDDRPKITVDGEAVVNVKPDKIIINLGIETWDVNIIVAKQRNNEILKKAMAVMKELGVPEKEIQTDHLSIEPRWKNEYRNEGFIGYFVRNTIVATLTDLAKVEELVTKALQAGVNYIHGVDFQTTEFKKYREQARELALKAAKEKADKLAAVLGQSAGAPVEINENHGGSPSMSQPRTSFGIRLDPPPRTHAGSSACWVSASLRMCVQSYRMGKSWTSAQTGAWSAYCGLPG